MKKLSGFSKIYLYVILIIMYLPILVVILYSFNENRINSVWSGFSLKWYIELIKDKDLMIALKNSLILASVSSLSAGVIGTSAALGLNKLNFKGKELLVYLSFIPIMTPEIIMGILFLAYFSLLKAPLGVGTLVIAHTSFCIPYVFSQVRSRLVGLNPSYAEAAKDLGASELRVFFDIILPAIMPGLFSGILLSFVMSMDDVVISIFVNGSKFNTLPVKIYTQLKTSVSPKINALCTIMFFATIIIVGISLMLRNKDSEYNT